MQKVKRLDPGTGPHQTTHSGSARLQGARVHPRPRSMTGCSLTTTARSNSGYVIYCMMFHRRTRQPMHHVLSIMERRTAWSAVHCRRPHCHLSCALLIKLSIHLSGWEPFLHHFLSTWQHERNVSPSTPWTQGIDRVQLGPKGLPIMAASYERHSWWMIVV